MKIEDVRKSVELAKEFISRAKELEKVSTNASGHVWGCKESGALRRQSMELTRQLAKMRKPNW